MGGFYYHFIEYLIGIFFIFVSKSNFGGSIFGETKAFNSSAKVFGIIVIQDADNSLSSTNPTINAGDIVVLTVDTTAVFGSNGIGTRKEISIEIRPEFGAPGYTKVVTPPSFTENIVDLK